MPKCFSCIFMLLFWAENAKAATGGASAPNPLLWPLLLVSAALFVALWRQLRTRRNLRGLQQLTDSMIDSMSALVIGIDDQGQIIELNLKAADFLAKTKAEIHGQSLYHAFADLPISRSMIYQVLEHKTSVHADKLADRKNERVWDVRITPWFSEHRQGALLRLEEVTEQVQLETLMIQKEKLITISRLAVGMIHEINNPLASILQNTQVIHNRLGPQLQKNRLAAEGCGTSIEKIECYLRERKIDLAIEAVRESARRAARVIENLINFSRQDEENEAFNSLGNLLDRAIELAAGDFDLKQQYDFRQIRIERNYDPGLPPVRCRALKLQQAFFALLRFRAERMLTAENHCQRMTLSLYAEGDQVLLLLEDDGPLLSEEERRNLFRPSLSDPEGGLGLCVCHFIICNIHGGTISLETGDDGHSRLVVRLPIERSADD